MTTKRHLKLENKGNGNSDKLKNPVDSHRKPGAGQKHNSTPDVPNPRNPGKVKRGEA